MRRLSHLLLVLAMILATTGTAASAAPKTAEPPTIDIAVPTAVCVWNGVDYDLELTAADPQTGISGGTLSDFNMDVARMAAMTIPAGYSQTIRHESWGFGWWSGDGNNLPDFPYTLNSADVYDPDNPEIVPSWTHHSLTGTTDDATITDTE